LLIKILIAVFFLNIILYSPRHPLCEEVLKVGSKTFTESVILGEIIKQIAEHEGYKVTYLQELGGTRVLWNSLLKGEIDIYPEYTGTLIQEILSGKNIESIEQLENELLNLNIGISKPLGFNNTYIVGMKYNKARTLGISKISDLRRFPDLVLGFSSEFMDRKDGWPGLKQNYNLSHINVKGLDHDIAYRGLDRGSIDVIDLYSTDAEIEYYNIKTLDDDLDFFPKYFAVLVYRKEIVDKFPGLLDQILKLQDSISETTMIGMNSSVKLKGISESIVASRFLKEDLYIFTSPEQETTLTRFIRNTKNHLLLVSISLFMAILISIPLGILSYKKDKIGRFILSLVGIVQTIPSLALLVFMIPLLGIGSKPAIVALFLYSLLPIVRNTYTGLKDIPTEIRETAQAIGLSEFARLRLIELPIASRSILGGIKTSAVINVGTATLAALIGAGGYGQPIFTGIRLDNMGLILEGAIPAAVLALLVQGFFDLLEKMVVPKGLRLES